MKQSDTNRKVTSVGHSKTKESFEKCYKMYVTLELRLMICKLSHYCIYLLIKHIVQGE